MLSTWSEEFLRSRGVDRPDGRPLYRYRVKQGEYEKLKAALRRLSLASRATAIHHYEAGAIVLFLAEWWRRSYAGGPWKYESACAEIDISLNNPTTRATLLERGLAYWKRKVRRRDGHRQFLSTLVCEGGLPLRLAQREQTHIRRYLRSIFNEIAQVSTEDVHERGLEAAERHADSLPQGLRAPFVHELMRDLAVVAWLLQNELPPDEPDPVAYFNRIRPAWRDELPVDVSDRVALMLVRQSVLDAQAAKVRSGGALGFDAELLRVDDVVFALRRTVPSGLYSTDAVLRHFQWERGKDLPKRLRLFAHHEGSPPQVVANVLRVGPDEHPKYRVEPAAHVPEYVYGPGLVRLSAQLTTGEELGSSLVPGSALGDVPLLFERETAGSPSMLLGVGSAKTTRDRVLVAYPHGQLFPAICGAKSQEIGLVHPGSHTVVDLQESLDFNDQAGGCFSICIRAEEDELNTTLVPRGTVARFASSRWPTFAGPPRLLSGYRNLHEVPEAELFWKPFGPGRNWRGWDEVPKGEIVVRQVRNNAVLAETRLCIVPSDTSIDASPGDSPTDAVISSRGIDAENVRFTQAGQPLGAKIVRFGEEARFLLKSNHPNAATLQMKVSLSGGSKYELEIPFPAHGCRFVQTQGLRLSPDYLFSIYAASGIRAEAYGFHHRDHVELCAELTAPDVPLGVRTRLRFPMPEVNDGLRALNLRAIDEQLELLLSLSRHIDAKIGLSIETSGARHRRERIWCARFDVELVPDKDADTVVLPNLFENVTVPGAASALIRVDARSLLDFGATPDRLNKCVASTGMAWTFGANRRAPGPWLIAAWEGERCLARPLLWTVPGDVAAGSVLGKAILEPNQEHRGLLIKDALTKMERDLSDESWVLLRNYLQALGRFPAEAIDALGVLVTTDKTLLLAVLGLPRESIPSAWTRLRDLLFMWELLPVRSWVNAVREYATHLQMEFRGNDELSSFMEEREFVAAGIRPIVSWLSEARELAALREYLAEEVDEHFPAPESSGLQLARSAASREALVELMLRPAWKETCRRHQTASWEVLEVQGKKRSPEFLVRGLELPGSVAPLWKLLPMPPELGFRRPVAYAPLVAAIYSGFGEPSSTSKGVVDALKRLKSFDTDWFETAFPIFQAIVIAEAGIEGGPCA